MQPVRHHHTIERREGAPSTLLLMPAWSDFAGGSAAPGHIGVKLVTISPDNNRIGKPAVMGAYLLLDGTTGEPLALIDGPRLKSATERIDDVGFDGDECADVVDDVQIESSANGRIRMIECRAARPDDLERS